MTGPRFDTKGVWTDAPGARAHRQRRRRSPARTALQLLAAILCIAAAIYLNAHG